MQITASYFVLALTAFDGERMDFAPGEMVLFPDEFRPRLVTSQIAPLSSEELHSIEYCIMAMDWRRIAETKSEFAECNAAVQFFVHEFNADNEVRIVNDLMECNDLIPQMKRYSLDFLMDNKKFQGKGWQFIN